MLALHVDELLHGEALVIREIHEEGLGDDFEVLFDPVLVLQGFGMCSHKNKRVDVAPRGMFTQYYQGYQSNFPAQITRNHRTYIHTSDSKWVRKKDQWVYYGRQTPLC